MNQLEDEKLDYLVRRLTDLSDSVLDKTLAVEAACAIQRLRGRLECKPDVHAGDPFSMWWSAATNKE